MRVEGTVIGFVDSGSTEKFTNVWGVCERISFFCAVCCVCVCVCVCAVSASRTTNLSILEDEEAHVLPVVHLILAKYRRRKILYPHTRQLVAVDIVVLKRALKYKRTVIL